MSKQIGIQGATDGPAVVPQLQTGLVPPVGNTEPEDPRLSHMYFAEIKLESKKKEIESYRIYFSKHSADIVYQYKYIKMKEMEIQNEKLRILVTRDKVVTEITELSSKVRERIFKEFLESTLPERSLLTERSEVELPSEKESTNTLSYFLPKLNLKPKLAQQFILDLFQPNRQAFSSSNNQNLKQWLIGKEKYISYNYAQAILTINPADPLQITKKNKYLLKGAEARELDCVCLYIYYKFKSIREKPQSLGREKIGQLHTKNLQKFELAYNLLSETIILNGLMVSMDPKYSDLPFLQFYYVLLDVFVEFREYCYERFKPCLQFISGKLGHKSLFEQEVYLLNEKEKAPQLMRDLAIFMVTEYDITNDNLLRAMNLFEYLCNSSEKFYYLGLFLGDMYDPKLFGAPQNLDDDKRLYYYEAAERIRDQPRIALLSKARLNIMYQAKLEAFISPSQTPKAISNEEVERFYLRIFNLNKNHLLECFHPSALYFYAVHFLRCNDFKIKKVKTLEDIFPIKTVLLNREAALLKAQEKLNDLSILGEAGQLELYYRVLKYLRFEEVYEAALKIAGNYEDEKLLIPLAFCKEKGVGGPSDLEFVASVYLNSVNYYSEQKEYYRLSLVLYRIGMLLKRGGWPELGSDIVKASLRFCLKVELNESSVDKRFLFHLACIFEHIDMSERDSILRELLLTAYQLYPTAPSEYILHYEIERKIEKSLNRYKSRIKTNLNGLDEVVKIQTSFSEEFELRQRNKATVKACISKLQKLRTEIDLDFGRDLVERIKQIEKSGEKSELLRPIDPSLVTVQNELLAASPEGGKHQAWEMRFQYLKLKRQNELGALSMEKSAEKQMQFLIEKLTTGNPHAREVADSEAEQLREVPESQKMPEIDGAIFYKVRFLANNQLARRVVLEFDSLVETKYLIDNFQYFQTFNPFFLNYLGICYRSASGKHSVQLYSEYFERLGSQFGLGFVNTQEVAVDMVQKVLYQSIHAVRALHVVGRVSFFVANKYLAVTPDFNVHLVCPFWKAAFSDPSLCLAACASAKKQDGGKAWLPDVQHFPPEAFHLPGYAASLRLATKQFDLLNSQDAQEAHLFRFYSAADVWSLGVLLFQLVSAKPFFEDRQFKTFEDFRGFCARQKEVERHVDRKVGQLPANLPPEIRQALQGMLRWNPMARVNIGQVLAKVEAVVFNKIYRIEAVTFSEVVKLMFLNVYFEPAKVVKIEHPVEKLALVLPKGYLFEGDCINGVPNGPGVFKLKGKAVLKADFRDGRVSKNCELQFGEKDTLKVAVLPDDFPQQVTLCYDKNLPTCTSVELDAFEQKSWLPKISRLRDLFNNFSFEGEDLAPKTRNPIVSKSSIVAPEEDPTERSTRFSPEVQQSIERFSNASPDSPGLPRAASKQPPKTLRPLVQLQPEASAESQASLALETTAADDELGSKGFGRVRRELERYLAFAKVCSLCYDVAENAAEDLKFYVSRLESQNLGRVTPSRQGMVPSLFFRNPLRRPQQADSDPDPVLRLFSSEAVESLLASHAQQQQLKQRVEALGRYPTVFFDPFGNVLRMSYDREQHCVEPRLGIMVTSVEACKAHHLAVFLPEVSSRQLFLSRLHSFSLCDAGRRIRSFGELHQALQTTEFGFAIITELQSKQFRGEVNPEGSYKGIVIDRKNNLEYEGGVRNLVKQGVGKLKFRGALRFVGQFRDGVPHGKGLLLGEAGLLRFKGVFAGGLRRFGTSVGPDRKEVHGLHQASADASRAGAAAGLDGFVRENLQSDPQLQVAGSIRQRRKFPIYYCDVRGWDFDFSGHVKAELGSFAYFYGSYLDGRREGLGLLKLSNGSTVQGFWSDQVVRGEFVKPKAAASDSLAERRDRHAWVVRKGTFRVSSDFSAIEQFGLGSIVYLNGAVYLGEIRRDLPNGFGKKTEKKTVTYSGQFVDGEFEGVGRLEFAELRVSNEGQFRQGHLQGIGIFSNDSQRTVGMWEKVQEAPADALSAGRPKHRMRFSYSEQVDMRIHGFQLASIQSQVEYNEFSFEYLKIGLCSAEFRKVFRSENEKVQARNFLLMLLVEAALHAKLQTDSIFKVAQETLRQCLQNFEAAFEDATETSVFARYSRQVAAGVQATIDRYYPEYKGKTSEKEMKLNLLRRFTRSKWRSVKMKSLELDGIVDTLVRLLHGLCRDQPAETQALVEELAFGKLMDQRFAHEHAQLREAAYQKIALRLFARQQSQLDAGVKRYVQTQAEELKSSKSGERQASDSSQQPPDSQREEPRKSETSPSKHFARKSSVRSQEAEADRSSGSLDRHSDNEEERLPGESQERCPELLQLFGQQLRFAARRFEAWLEEANGKVPDRFEGEVFNNEVNGIGSLFQTAAGPPSGGLPEAGLYRGEFRDGHCSGLGVLRLAGDRVFKGVVARGRPSGWGEAWVGRSTCFLGHFCEGRRVGVFAKVVGGAVASLAQFSEQEQQVFAVRRVDAETDAVDELLQDGRTRTTRHATGTVWPRGFSLG